MIAWGQSKHNSAKYSFACLKQAEILQEQLLSDSPFPKTPFAAVGLVLCFAVSNVGFIIANFYIKQKKNKQQNTNSCGLKVNVNSERV